MDSTKNTAGHIAMEIKNLFNNIIVLLLIVIMASLFIIKFIESKNNGEVTTEQIIRPVKNLEKMDGVVTNIWLDNPAKLDNLRNLGVKYLIVDVGGTNSNGKLETSEEEIKSFLDFINIYEQEKNYNFIILPYSEINTYNYDIDSEGFLQNMIDDYKTLVIMGFDGVFVDIEPIQFIQREKYLQFLYGLSKTFDEDIIIAVYAGHLGSSFDNEWEWNQEYYKRVGNLVDLISVPAYDLDFNNAQDYKSDVKNKIRELNSLGLNAKLFLGVPTHNPDPETIENALNALSVELTLLKLQRANNSFIGVIIFAEWTTSQEEWKIFKSFKKI